MAKQFKVLDICEGIHLVCIRYTISEDPNPYRLFLVYNARHETYGYYTERRKQIAKYGNIESVLCMIKDLYIAGIQYCSVPNVISWCDRYYNS